MNQREYRDRQQFESEARQQLSELRIVRQSKPESGFQYGYLARLIDDRELALIEDAAVRAATRAAHRQVYWKSLRLLRRDVNRMMVNRRKLMDARQEWRFESLVSDTARVWRLIWTLRIAGVAHGAHVPLLVAQAGEACTELRRLMSVTSAPAIHAA